MQRQQGHTDSHTHTGTSCLKSHDLLPGLLMQTTPGAWKQGDPRQGYVFTVAGAPVSWTSRRQEAVATATLDAEYMAATNAAKEAVWLRRFTADLRLLHQPSVALFIDNNSALRLSKNPENHKRAKHIDVRHHFLREHVVQVKDIKTERVDTITALIFSPRLWKGNCLRDTSRGWVLTKFESEGELSSGGELKSVNYPSRFVCLISLCL